MKSILPLLAAGAFAVVCAAPAGAAEQAAPGATSTVTQLSAKKKYRRYYGNYYRGYYAPAPYVPYGYYGYGLGYGGEPTASPYSNLRRQQRLGRCVFDLGYGRYQLCN
jgi:hypothetical protein